MYYIELYYIDSREPQGRVRSIDPPVKLRDTIWKRACGPIWI